MSVIEWRALGALYHRKDWRPVQRLGIRAEHFQEDGEARELFEFFRQHWHSGETAKQFPSRHMLRKRFPGIEIPEWDETPLETCLIELRHSVASHDLKAIGETFIELSAYEDMEEAWDLASALMSETGHRFKGRGAMRVSQVAQLAKQRYLDSKQGVSWGIEYPWAPLTWDTKGMCPADLIFIYARQKQMKTWISTFTAADAFGRQDRRVLFWSREMTIDQMAMRFASIWTKADYNLIEHGLLPLPIERHYMQKLSEIAKHYERSAEQIKELKEANQADILFMVGRDAPQDMDGLKAAIDDFEPDVVFLDSVHKLNPSKGGRSDSDRQRNLAEELKDLAINVERPFVTSSHANRDGEKVGKFGTHTMDIGRTDAWAGEADLLVRVIKKKLGDIVEPEYEGFWDEEERQIAAKKQQAKKRLQLKSARRVVEGPALVSSRPPKARTKAELAMVISGARRGTLDGILIDAVPGYRFDVKKEELSHKELAKWIKEADEAEEKELSREEGREARAARASSTRFEASDGTIGGRTRGAKRKR